MEIICAYCQKPIESVRYKTHRQKRYHVECYEALIQEANSPTDTKPQAPTAQSSLEQYIKQLFEIKELTYTLQTQVRMLIERDHMQPETIQKILEYFYVIKGHAINREQPSIGIVPYVFEEAREFYKSLYDIQHQPKVADVKVDHQVMRIKPPDASLPIYTKIENL